MNQLNIKNEEAYRLAQELSRATGEKMTQAVIKALKDRLDAIQRTKHTAKQARLDDILSIADRCANLPAYDDRHPNDILYDGDGLPKDATS